MSRADKNHLVVLGLPESGKTTYLAALWHLLTAKDVKAHFRVDELQGDRSYLDQIRDEWLGCDPVTRTKVDREHAITLPLCDDEGRSLVVEIPDLAGETFQGHWADREWPESYASRCAKATGLLLFIHSDKVKEPFEIGTADKLLAGIDDDGPDESEGKAGEQTPSGWNPEEAPTQVQLVSLLQTVMLEAKCPLRVAVLLSAWDLVNKPPEPAAWLQRRLPLLDQFLRANDLGLRARIYGVSAQGGDLQKQADELLSKDNPSERIQIVGPDVQPHDLSAPLRWLLG